MSVDPIIVVLGLIQVAITFLACRSARLNAKAVEYWRKRNETAYESGSLFPLSPTMWWENHIEAIREKALELMLEGQTCAADTFYKYADKLEARPGLTGYQEPKRTEVLHCSYWGVIIEHRGNGVYEVRREDSDRVFVKATEVNGSQYVCPGTVVRCYESGGRVSFCLPMGASA